MSWIEICAIKDIPMRGARTLKTAQGCVAVFRTGEAEIFAASDTCPQKGGPLSEGSYKASPSPAPCTTGSLT